MNLPPLLFLLYPILIGYLLVQILLPSPIEHTAGSISVAVFLFKFFLAPGSGYALISLLFFVWSLLFSPSGSLVSYFILESLALLALLILAFYLRRGASPANSMATRKAYGLPVVLGIAAAMVFTLFLLNFLNDWHASAMDKPFGGYDAWAIWNLRASFIASGDEWLKGFSSAILWSHPDYPLLLPLNVARLWVLLGQRSVFAPMLLGLIFQLSLVGLLLAVVVIRRGWLQGFLAGMLGIAVIYVSLNFQQYADIPLAFYFLAGNALLYLDDSNPESSPWITLLAGLSLGAALWTKNEGWILVVAALGVKLLLDLFSHKSLAQMVRWIGFLFAGLFPFLVATLYFKLFLAPPNDLLSELSLGAVKSKLVDPSRYLTIFRALRGQFIGYGELAIPLIPMLLVYPLFTGFSIPKEEHRATLGLFLRITAIAAAYFLTYLLTPKPLAWHLSTSLERLITQLIPSALLLYFLLVSPPIKGTTPQLEPSIASPPLSADSPTR